MADNEERGFLAALKQTPTDVTTRLAYADWLEEHDRPYEAMLQRVKAGVSETRFRIRRKSDGLFYDGGSGWVADKPKEWRLLSAVRGHLTMYSTRDRFMDSADWDDVEVVVYEVRVQPVLALTVTRVVGQRHRAMVNVHEPKYGKTP